MANGALATVVRSAALGANEIGCELPKAKPATMKTDDEDEFEHRPGIVVGAAEPHAAQMHERGEPGHDHPEGQLPAYRQPE